MVSKVTVNLAIPHPFDLTATLESGQAHRWHREGRWYCGVVYGNMLKVRQNHMGIEVFSAPAEPEELIPLLTSYFRLDDNLDVVYQTINRDPLIADMIDRYAGLRLLRQEPWECLVAFICSATSNIPRIGANMEAIADTYGQRITLQCHSRFSFPSADRLAEAGEQALRDIRLGFRAKYLAYAAREVAEGNLDLEKLRSLSYWDAKTCLMDIPGIGAKIADCVLAFSLDKMEAFPIDRWVNRAMQEWYLNGRKMSYEQVVRWAQSYFGPYAGYAQQYLFHGRRLDRRVRGTETRTGK